MTMTNESDEVSMEELEAATMMHDAIMDGTFYQKQIDSGFTIKFINKGGDK